MRKKTMIGIFGLIICLMIIQISPIRGANFKRDDPSGDVNYHTNFTVASYSLNVYPEIDLTSLEIEGEIITLSFVAAPVADANYLYKIFIFWIGDDPVGNWTKYLFSDSENSVHTRIEDSTGGAIMDETQTGVIDTAGLTMLLPIYNSSMIPNISNPEAVSVFTYYYINQEGGEYYQDDIFYVSGLFPGFTFWITMTGIATIAVIGLIIKRKKN